MRNYADYKPDETLSSFAEGDPEASVKVILLHGIGANADDFKSIVNQVYVRLPFAEVIAINGVEKLSDQQALANDNSFSWQTRDKKDQLLECLGQFKGAPEKTFLFGFSQGGFVAAHIAYHHPEISRHAILHSSGLLMSKFNGRARDHGQQSTFDTLIAIDDPYLRNPLAFSFFLPSHFINAISLKLQGHKTSTRISSGFGHGISDKSLEICIKTIERRLEM